MPWAVEAPISTPRAGADGAGGGGSPIGSQRRFISMPARIAVATPPPAASTVRAANCAAPENTVIDITTGATGPITGRPSTPNETPSANVGSTSGSPLRIPALTSMATVIPIDLTG